MLTVLLACSFLPGAARAATYTWDGGLSHSNFTFNDLWTTPNNWVGGVPPVSSIDTDLIFTLSGVHTTANQNIADPFSLHSLTFDSNNTDFTAISGGTLDFRNNSAAAGPTLTQNSTVAVTINNALALTNTLAVSVNPSGLTLAGAISGAGGMTKTGNGTLTLNAANTYSDRQSDGTVIERNGTLTLNAANTYSGATSINAGAILLGNASALQNSTVTSATDNALIFQSGIGTFTVGNLAGSANQELADNAATPGAVTLQVGNNGASTTYLGTLSGAGTLVKVGAGTLFLAGANTYTGPTVIDGGVLAINDPSALGGTSNLNFTGGELRAVATTSLRKLLTVNSGQTAIFSASPGVTFSFNNSLFTSGNATLVFGSAGQTGIVAVDISVVSNFASPLQIVVNAGTLRTVTAFLAAKSLPWPRPSRWLPGPRSI